MFIKFRNIITSFIIVLFSIVTYAQNTIRFTNFAIPKVSLNPALAGGFDGIVRIGSIVRNQKYKLQSESITSSLVYLDASIFVGFRKQDWIGLGVSFQNDKYVFKYDDTQSSSLNLTNTIGGISYHFAFDKQKKNVLAVGFQAIKPSFDFKSNVLLTPTIIEKYFEGTIDDIYILEPSQNKENNIHYNIGAVFTSNISKTDYFRVGLSIGDIGKKSIINRSNNRLNYVFFGEYKTELKNGLILEPRAYYSYKEPNREGNAQILLGYRLKKPKYIVLAGGLGINSFKRIQVLTAAVIKNIKIALSYDFVSPDNSTVSSSKSTGFELGISYILQKE